MKECHPPILLSIALLLVCTGCSTTPPALPPSVHCIAELTSFVKDSPWFEDWVDADGNANHCDGVAPCATFRIISPEPYSGRIVNVTFRFPSEGVPQPPSSSPTGGLFTIELPCDFLEGDYPSIYDRDVKKLKERP